jgi:hypothetical protein
MQFTKPFKEAIRSGKVPCTFRTWKSPQARVGGRYNLHPSGTIEVTSMHQIRIRDAKPRRVTQSGFDNLDALVGYLKTDANDLVYLVEFRYLGDITVNQPLHERLSADEHPVLAQALRRIDERSGCGP